MIYQYNKCNGFLIDWLISRLIDWVVDLFDLWVGWKMYLLIQWSDWFINWLIDWISVEYLCRLSLIVWLIRFLLYSREWCSIDWLVIYWLDDVKIPGVIIVLQSINFDWLIWLIGWLIGWLIDWFPRALKGEWKVRSPELLL